MNNSQQIIRQPYNNGQFSMDKLEVSILRHILMFLNIVELCALCRVCNRWKNLIEKDTLIFANINLEILSPQIKVLNLLKLFSTDKHIRQLQLPKNASASDTSYLLMCIPPTLNQLNVYNINMELSKVFSRRFEFLEKLTLCNVSMRKRVFDETELKAIIHIGSNVKELALDDLPITDSTLAIILSKYKNLTHLSLTNAPQLGNQSLQSISKLCLNLQTLKIGGSRTNYNILLTQEGFEVLGHSVLELKDIQFIYLARVGDNVIRVLAESFKKTLQRLDIIRNCFERCSKISDKGISYLADCRNLTSLQIVYSRKFRQNIHKELSNLHNLRLSIILHKNRHLNLKNCPIQQDLSLLAQNCPHLIEINLSGDSWVCESNLIGLAKHPALKVLHIGHFQHGDQNCDRQLQQYPPEGMFIESIFKQEWAFPKLGLLYLQADCNLTYWLDVKLQIARPLIFIKYTKGDDILNK